MARRDKKKPSYRAEAFTHWLNLAFLALGGVAAVTYDPLVLLAVGPIELGLMWIIPDLPGFKSSVDKRVEMEDIEKEREYYAKQLWELAPPTPPTFGEKIASLFTEVETEALHDRVLDTDNLAFVEYMEMRRIIAKLDELEHVRGTSISKRDIQRFEQVVNGYLRYRIGIQALTQALHNLDTASLTKELDEIDEKIKEAPAPVRTVLLEQKRLKESRLHRIPKLQATLELFRTRADTIVHQMRNIHSQVITDPGMEVNAFLDELVERQEILSDPLGALEADNALREFMNPGAAVRAAAEGKQAGGTSK